MKQLPRFPLYKVVGDEKLYDTLHEAVKNVKQDENMSHYCKAALCESMIRRGIKIVK